MMNTCRFCLKSSEKIQFTLPSTCSSYIKLILPEIDLNLTESPQICSMCVNHLEDAYNFKMRCLQSEEQLKSIKNTTIKYEVETDIKLENDIEYFYSNEVSFELEQQKVNDIIAIKVELNYETFPETTRNRIETENLKECDTMIKDEIEISENEINSCSFQNVQHLKETRYKCKWCRKKFLCMSSLQKHKLCHVNQKKYVCKICKFINIV